MNWFQPSAEVQEKRQLFGWNNQNGLLDGLIKTIVQARSNVQIIGERRSGKSSILNCLKNELNKKIHSTRLIPVIVNFNKFDDVTDVNGYNVFSSSILSSLDNIPELRINQPIKISSKTINPSSDANGFMSNLDVLTKRKSKSVFRNLIIYIAEKGYSILLLIDEYEPMFCGTFKGKKGSLYGVRDLITNEQLPNNAIFQCCITGTRIWSDIENTLGSDDFNFINETLYIPSLNNDAQEELITFGFEHSLIDIQPNDVKRICDFSRGSPFLIKSLCQSYILHGSLAEENFINKFDSIFATIWRRLTIEQQQVIKGEKDIKNQREYLINLNLIEKVSRIFNNKYIPKGILWKNYVEKQEITHSVPPVNVDGNSNRLIAELQQIATITINTISDINDVLNGKSLDRIFDSTLSTSFPKYLSRFFNPCHELNDFKEFIVGLYIILFETTQRYTITTPNPSKFPELENALNHINNNNLICYKHWTEEGLFICHSLNKDNRAVIKKEIEDQCGFIIRMGKYPMNMAALPPQFNRFPEKENCPEIFHKINILRHHWGEGHDTQSENFVSEISPSQAQQSFLGHKNHPQDQEWSILQLGILLEFNKVLISMRDWANEQK